jgi:hypothetical protein
MFPDGVHNLAIKIFSHDENRWYTRKVFANDFSHVGVPGRHLPYVLQNHRGPDRPGDNGIYPGLPSGNLFQLKECINLFSLLLKQN